MDRKKILFCFFLSGACGLVYEVIWVRMLTLIFGNTTYAVSTVLCAFMAGLALGSWYFGRLVDRVTSSPLALFAFFEAGIGFYCIFTPLLFKLIQYLYVSLSHLTSHLLLLTSFRFLFSFIIMLIPTALMGGTLPVLSKLFIQRKEEIGEEVGILYSVNTWGGVLGTFATGFLLMILLGVRGTLYTAAIINLAISAFVYYIRRATASIVRAGVPACSKQADTVVDTRITQSRNYLSTFILVAFALSGFTALVYEVTWTRVLSMIIGSSVYAFSIMLTAFLAGIVLGSLLFAKFFNQLKNQITLFGLAEMIIGFSVLLLIPLFGILPFIFVDIFKQFQNTFYGFQMMQFIMVFLVMLLPTTLFGLTLPLVAKICTSEFKMVGRSVGKVYMVNTVGAILGSFAAGFMLIPLFGLQITIRVMAFLNLLIGMLLLYFGLIRKKRLQTALVFACLIVVVISLAFPIHWNKEMLNSGVFVYAPFYASFKGGSLRERWEIWKGVVEQPEILYYSDKSPRFIVAVKRNLRSGILSLSIDGKTDASNNYGGDMPNQLLIGHLPLFLHPQAKSALVVGLAGGITLGAVQQHPLERIDCVEIEPAMIEASRFFIPWNHNCLKDRRTRLIIEDGRSHLLVTKKRYDVIISGLTNPWISGVSNLFTQEYFELCKRKLNPDGIFCSWIPYYKTNMRDFKIFVNTFRSVFPHSSLWLSSSSDSLLIGMDNEFSIDYPKLKQRLADPKIRADLQSIGLDSPAHLLSIFVMAEKTLSDFCKDLPVNTDNRPYIEFSAPKGLYDSQVIRKNLQILRKAAEDVSPYLINM
ncbi:MAG: fused MFS/spermidine synthase [Planctomycetota bacterium]|jgi:spermidine synthase